MDWQPLILTFKLATVTTLCLLVTGIPVAYWLVNTKSKIKPVIEALVSLPLVLPPTVLGFYFLLAFSPAGWLGGWLNHWFNIRLVFSFPGLVVASILYSMPFMVHPLQNGLSALPRSLQEAAYLMGKSKTETLFRVLLPNIKPALLTGTVLAFAHTIGEFGVVLMIGGNIPGKTKVASIAIYDQVEALNYAQANRYSLILLGISFSVLLLVYLLNGRFFKPAKK